VGACAIGERLSSLLLHLAAEGGHTELVRLEQRLAIISTAVEMHVHCWGAFLQQEPVVLYVDTL
jgi:hypothetical protein